MLLIIALFANAIYGDVIEYLKLKNKLEFLEIALISKWFIIIFNIVFSVYLLITMFKKENEENKKDEKSKVKAKESKTQNKKEEPKEEKFTAREKEFLNKKKIRSAADILVEK